MASFFVDWPKYLDFGVVESTITNCNDYFGNQTEYGVFQLSQNPELGRPLEDPECINFSIFKESKLILGCFLGFLGLLALCWLVFGHLFDKIKITTERQIDDLSTGEFYGSFGVQMKFSINKANETKIFDLYLLFENENGDKQAIIYRDANKKMAKNGALTLSVDDHLVNDAQSVSICLSCKESADDYYGFLSSFKIINDGAQIGSWNGTRSLFALQPSIIKFSKTSKKVNYLSLTKIFPKIEEILISLMAAVLVYSSLVADSKLNEDDQITRIRAMRDVTVNAYPWLNRMLLVSIAVSIPAGILFKIVHILMEYDTENISHVPVLLTDRQLKITENGENTWISCLMGQTEPCPQASALIFSRMIHKKGFIRGENQRAVFMKGTKAKLGYKITTKIDAAGDRFANTTEFFSMDQRKFSLMLEDIEMDVKVEIDPKESNSTVSGKSNMSRVTIRADSHEVSVVPSSVRVRDSLRGMMMKTVRSEPMEDFENNARSEHKLRRASNPEAGSEEYHDAESEAEPVRDGLSTNPMLNSRIWESPKVLKENEWLFRPEDIPGSDPKNHDPTGESVTVVNPIFHPEMFQGVDEETVKNLTDPKKASELIAEAYKNNPSMLSVPTSAIPALEEKQSRRLTEKYSSLQKVAQKEPIQSTEVISSVSQSKNSMSSAKEPPVANETAPPVEQKRRRRKKVENVESTIAAPAEQVTEVAPSQSQSNGEQQQQNVVKKRRRKVEAPATVEEQAPAEPIEPPTTQVVVKKKRRRKVVDPAPEPSQGATRRHWRKKAFKMAKMIAPVAEIIFFLIVTITAATTMNASLFNNKNELFLTHIIGITFISQIIFSTTIGDRIIKKSTEKCFG